MDAVSEMKRHSSAWRNLAMLAFGIVAIGLPAHEAQAQTMFTLGGNGLMGLGGPNGEFTVEQDDLIAKVPGGYVRINRDFDGRNWSFNRQWSGLGHPDRYQATYQGLKNQTTCTVIDGVKSCDTTATASAGNVNLPMENFLRRAVIPGDLFFGTSYDGTNIPPEQVHLVARKGVMFTRTAGTDTFVSTKYPRFVLRQQSVQMLPPSSGPDTHPVAGKPGKGGIATRAIDGYRWTDRTGQWIEYDARGRITSYGDRNDVRVWFQYGTQGQVERVLDDNGRTVFTLLYKDGGKFVTEARDHTDHGGTPRRVQYRYDNDGFMTEAVDVLGGSTRYEYVPTSPEPLSPWSGDIPDRIDNGLGKVIDPEGRELKVTYGVTRRVSSLTAPDGGVTDIEYGYDKATKQFNTTIRYPHTPSGRRVEFRRFNSEGQMVHRDVNGKTVLTSAGGERSQTYTDERGATTTIERDVFGEISRRIFPGGQSVRYQYHPSSLDLAEIVDERGTSTKLTYDERGNITEITAAAGTPIAVATSYAVNSAGDVEGVTRHARGDDEKDVVLRMSYDAQGSVNRYTDGAGFTWLYQHDGQGNVTEMRDPRGSVHRYQYDADGNRISEVDPEGGIWRFTYDKTRRLKTATDPLQRVLQLEYDAAGRMTTENHPDGSRQSVLFDKAGRLIEHRDGLGQRMSLAYDSADRLISISGQDEPGIGFGYLDVDGADRGSELITNLDLGRQQTQLRYNARQGLTQIEEISGSDRRSYRFVLDAMGDDAGRVDEYGRTSTAERDALGRLTKTIDPLGGTTTLSYDALGNVARVTDERGGVVRFVYDGRGLPVEEIDALGSRTRYEYDGAGFPTAIVRANGAKINFEFSASGRMLSRVAYTASGSTEGEVRFNWNLAGELTGWRQVADGITSESQMELDRMGRLLKETINLQGVAMTRAYTYDADGRMASYTSPDGQRITYRYDGRGSLAGVTIPGQGELAMSRSASGDTSAAIFPGGTRLDVSLDGFSNITSLQVRRPDQTLSFSQQSEYGLANEVILRQTQGREVEYQYDDLMRLTRAEASRGTDERYELDGTGNRLSDHADSSTWIYNEANQLLKRGRYSYEYDINGNMIRRTDSAGTGAAGAMALFYDAYNRVVEVRDGVGEKVARYAYDPFGMRISKHVFSAGQVSKAVLYLHGEEGLLAELDLQGRTIQSYGWEPGAKYGSFPMFLSVEGAYYFYHNDPTGRPLLLTDRNGATVWEATAYTSFGHATVSGIAGIRQPWRLPGQYYDDETDLHYNVNRYYDPDTGRYLSADPAGMAGGLNSYLYAGASPTIYIDPYGLWVDYPDTGNALADSTFGAFYFVTNGWSPGETATNFAAGMGDTLSFNLTRYFREATGLGSGSVDYCSTAYGVGGVAGMINSLAFGGVHLGRHAMANGAKSLFHEVRTFGTISKRYHRQPWKGGYDLDHFFFANRKGQKGLWNNGFNLLPLTSRFNRQTLNADAWKKGRRWIPHALRGTVRAAVAGNYLAVPTFLGSKAYDNGMDGECGCN